MFRKLAVSFILAAIAFLSASAQDGNVQISTMHTTHIIFSTDLTYVDISNKVIAAKIVESSKNILAIKAREPFDFTTTVSILEANGQLHTFYVNYAESPQSLVRDVRKVPEEQAARNETPRGKDSGASVSATRKSNAPALSEIAQRRQEIFHVADRRYGLLALVENVFVYSDITYVTLSVRNSTGISYESTDARFVIETRKKSKRVLDVDKTLYAKSRYGTLIVPAGETVKVVYSFPKVTLTRDQLLRVYLYEQNGSRNLCLTLNHDDLNNARTAY